MNTNESDFELIRRCRDGEASAEELAALESRLLTDAEFRQSYVRYLNLDLALETTVVALEPAPKPAPARIRVGWFGTQWLWGWQRPAVAGVVTGLLSASVAWAVALPWLTEPRMAIQTILSESFESGTAATSLGLPRDCDVWSGDEATVVTAEQGVKPKSGGKMWRFLSASHAGDYVPRNQWSDVYRLVDVRGVARNGHDLVRLSASFTQTPVPAGEQFACSVEVIALEHNPGSQPMPLALPRTLENGSIASSRTLPMAGHRQWQDVSVEVPLSPQTQFLLLHVAMTRTSPTTESGAVRFSGHYMDDVKLELVSRR